MASLNLHNVVHTQADMHMCVVAALTIALETEHSLVLPLLVSSSLMGFFFPFQIGYLWTVLQRGGVSHL